MKNLWNWLILGLAFVLSACGGGGDSSPTPTPTTFTITATAGTNGTITPLGSTVVTQGSSQGFTITPNSGYKVATLLFVDGAPTGDAVTTGTSTTYTFTNVDRNHTINAAFFAIPPPPTYHISGSVTGGVQAGVTITASHGGASTVTATDGTYSMSGFQNGGYTVTPSLAGQTFTPASTSVTVNGADVTGVNFTTPWPMQTTGKLLFPSNMAIDVKDLSTGVESLVWGASNVYPDTIVPARTGGIIAFNGSNINCIKLMSLTTQIPTGCLAPVGDLQKWDITQSADVVVTSDSFTPIGSTSSQQNIILYKMDGSGSSFRVTNGLDVDTSPAICSVGDANTQFSVCWIRNGTDILLQVVDLANNLVVGSSSVIASNVMDDVRYLPDGGRAMSASPDYSQLVFMKNVGGVAHVTVKPLSGGVEVDLGVGVDPYWALDGSNRIKYTDSGSNWSILPDGTGRMQIPTPSNLDFGIGGSGLINTVFGPAGF